MVILEISGVDVVCCYISHMLFSLEVLLNFLHKISIVFCKICSFFHTLFIYFNKRAAGSAFIVNILP
jgi:hypothetical protein